MITKQQYVEYALGTPKDYPCTYLAEHLEDVSHDGVNDFLRQQYVMPRDVWELVNTRIEESQAAFLLVDESVQDKRSSRFLALVRLQCGGNEPGVIKGMIVVSLGQSAGKDADFYPLDYQVYAPDVDGKTKNDHFQEMLVNVLDQKQLKARTILWDGSYASVENVTLIHRRQRMFFTTLKRNRLVSLSKKRDYSHRREFLRTPATLASGILGKSKEVPSPVRLFELVAPNGDMDWVSTDDRAEMVPADVAEASSDVRWQVEELHQGLRQLMGSEQCQCRAATAQRLRTPPAIERVRRTEHDQV